jgi:hypothetical protein
MDRVNFQEQLQTAATDMKTAEACLLNAGFSSEHWVFIKQYVQACVFHFQLAYAKALLEAPRD